MTCTIHPSGATITLELNPDAASGYWFNPLHREEDVNISAADQDLSDIQDALRGNDDAFAHLVQRYQSTIFRQMWHYARQQADVEELVQEVFVEAFTSLKGFKAKAPFEHWLRRIATRVGYRYWKQKGQNKALQEALHADALVHMKHVETNLPSEAAEILYALLEQLRPRDRLVLTMMYLDGCTSREIAERSGWTHSMVRVQIHRAKRRLRALLEAQGFTGANHD